MDEQFWFGTEASLNAYLRYLDYMAEQSPDALMQGEAKEYEDLPPLVQLEGQTGIINISGSLIPNSNWISRLFGMTGYDDIEEAAQFLLEDDSVENIVLAIGSGGGAVSGLESAGQTLQVVGKEKPIYTVSDSGMLSAAYYLGSVGRSIAGSPMTQFGSIGTVITHVSIQRMLKESGRDVTIIRSGKYKALGHPAEKLSKEAKAKLQAEADKLTQFFRSHVEEMRGAALGEWDSWGEGKTFFTDEAIRVGLADRQETLSQLVTRLNSNSETVENPVMAKKKVVLQDEQAAAQLESGVPLENVKHTEEEVPEKKAESEDGQAAMSDETQTEEGGAEALAEEQTSEALASDSKEEKPVDSGVVAFLKETNAELHQKLLKAEADLAVVKKDLADMQASQPALMEIAVSAIQKMQIGMGQTPAAGLASMNATSIVEQYASVKKQFNETFPVGQKSAETPTEDSPQAKVTPLSFGIIPKAHNS